MKSLNASRGTPARATPNTVPMVQRQQHSAGQVAPDTGAATGVIFSDETAAVRSTEGTCTCPPHFDPLGCMAETCPRVITARAQWHWLCSRCGMEVKDTDIDSHREWHRRVPHLNGPLDAPPEET